MDCRSVGNSGENETVRLTLLLIPTSLLFAALGCGDGNVDDGRLGVAVSVEPHAYLARRIGGDRVTVRVLVGPGESPATYQPADLQVTEVMRSALYFRTGVPFERGKWLPSIREVRGGPVIVDLREGVELRTMEAGHDHEAEGHLHGEHAADDARDPHIWLSPRLLAVQAQTVAGALVAADPEGAPVFRDNLAGLLADLERVTAEVRGILAPIAGKKVHVFHPAYGYFCDEFGLTQVAIEAEGKEPSDRELTALLTQAREDGVRAIFVQEQITGRSAGAIAESLGVDLIRLDPLSRDVTGNYVRMANKMRSAFP
jgi:zinc transport system substrate-binding protein